MMITGKYCTYCRKADHNDSECWCTRVGQATPITPYVLPEPTNISPTLPTPIQTAGASIDTWSLSIEMGCMVPKSPKGVTRQNYYKVEDADARQQQAVADALAGHDAQRPIPARKVEYWKQRAEKAEAERDAAKETWVDEDGTTWSPPTAFAYARVCRALKLKQDCKECDGKGWRQLLHGEDSECESCSDQQPPDAALAQVAASDKTLLAKWEVVKEIGKFHSMLVPTDAAILAYARAILATPQPAPVADALAGQAESLAQLQYERDNLQLLAVERGKRAAWAEAERDELKEQLDGEISVSDQLCVKVRVLEKDRETALAQVAGGQVPVYQCRTLDGDWHDCEKLMYDAIESHKTSYEGFYRRVLYATPQPAPVAGEVDERAAFDRTFLSLHGFHTKAELDIEWSKNGAMFCAALAIGAAPSGYKLLPAAPPAISTSKGAAPSGYALQSPVGQIVGQVHATRAEAERFAMLGNTVVKLAVI